MTPETRRRVEELFDALVELRPDARRRALDDARVRENEVASEVERLLRAHDASDGFIERPAYESAGATIVGASGLDPGTRIGRYRVVREIGRGGMGEVYLAERADASFQQRVAIKVVKRGMDTDEILARFLAERQTLANLRHPNITALLDGGVTDDGRPYLVMEHVEGAPIDRHCSERALSIRARLELFCKVCDAVHTAHMNLVVHRDLKPSNILVMPDGEPKLLDFGVAKALSSDAQNPDERTESGLRLLTPHFASPEQLRGERVTTATDVYSLGLILCVLLTGKRPFDDGASVEDEATRRDHPTKPSRIAERSAPDDRLARTLRGDLDTIVLTALRADPRERYTSARALADDIRRHLDGMPIAARPRTAAYTLAKFVRRRPFESGAGALAALALLTALVVSIASQRATEKARALETTQRELAERRAAESGAVVEFMRGIFASIDPSKARGRDTALLRETMDLAAARLDEQPGLSATAQVAIRSTIGGTYRAISDQDRAEAQFERALGLIESGADVGDEEAARALRGLGLLRLEQSRFEEAQALLDRAMLLIERADDAPWKPRERLATLETLAIVRLEVGDLPGAEARLRELLVAQDTQGVRPATIDARSVLPVVLAQQGNYEDALEMLRARLAELLDEHGEDDPETIGVRNSLGVVLRRMERNEEAAEMYATAAVAAFRVFGPTHRAALTLRSNEAVALEAIGRVDDAERIYLDVLAIQRETLGDAHDDTLSSTSNLAILYTRAERYAESEALLREALSAHTEARGDRSLVVGVLYGGLGRSLQGQGRMDEAERAFLHAHEIMVEIVGHSNPATQTAARDIRAFYGPDGINDPERLAAFDRTSPTPLAGPGGR
jgi:serine/threonine-protein kinase